MCGRQPQPMHGCVACFFVLCTLLPSLAASNPIEGRVYLRKGSSTAGLPKTFVSARSTVNGELLAVIRTGRGGHYQFQSLPAVRLVLTAFRPGYHTRLAAGRTASEIRLDCSTGCAYSDVDFELVRGAVVTGRVADALGEPVEGARVSVVRQSKGHAESRTGRPKVDLTDDRGVFRLAGLEEGAYRLRGALRRSGETHETPVREIELAEGELLEGIALTLGSHSNFRVAGRVTGIDFAGAEQGQAESLFPLTVRLHPASRGGGQRSARALLDGSFVFRSVRAGRYRVSAVVGRAERGQKRQEYHLDVIEVDGDRTGLVLRPSATGSVEGRVRLASGRMPAWVNIVFTSNAGLGTRGARATPRNLDFQAAGLVPGSYQVKVHASALYIKDVLRNGRTVPTDELAISTGENRLEIVLAGDHGRVYGTIHEPGTGQLLPLARVALKSESGLRSQQVDQMGKFLFDKVIPGDYQICAWGDIRAETIEDEQSWQETGCDRNVIPVAAESDVEIDLTAAGL